MVGVDAGMAIRQGRQAAMTRPNQRPRRPAKRGLTRSEQDRVILAKHHDQARWEHLFHPDRNRWKPSA